MPGDESRRSELIGLDKRVESLLTSVDGLRHSVDADRTERERENKKRDQRIRWNRFATVAALLIGVFGLLIGWDAKATSNDIIKTRDENRAAACEQDNALRTKIDTLDMAIGFILDQTNTPRPGRTADVQAQVDAFFAQAHKTLDEARPKFRDCSPSGIKRYLSTTTTAKESN